VFDAGHTSPQLEPKSRSHTKSFKSFMGQQSNKVQKRRRRASYEKRKRETVKVKPGKKPAKA